MSYFYPTAFTHWDSDEREAMSRVVRSGNFTMGREGEMFEDQFARFHGRKHCIMVNSGSSANLIAMTAYPAHTDVTPSVPALAWATTFSPLMQRGVRFALEDCDDTWNAPGHCDVSVPILGNPRSRNCAIEDFCESFGAKDEEGRRCGTFGVVSTTSFFYSHQLSAIEGGAILTESDDIARMCRLLRNHGWTKGEGEPKSFAEEYQFVVAGYNLRPLEMHAAIARAQLHKTDGNAAGRRKNWRYFAMMAEKLNLKMQEITSPDWFNPFCIAFTVPSAEIRETLAQALRAEGVDCRPAVGGSFRLQPYGKDYADSHTPNADRIHHTGMMLGCAPYDISPQIDKAITVMRRYL